jgi:hypothetical protein
MTVTDCELLPELLAVTVMVEVPAGVLGGEPQATIPEMAAASTIIHKARLAAGLSRFRCQYRTKLNRPAGSQHSSVEAVPDAGVF